MDQLGLSSTSAIKGLRARAAQLELDVSHFRGQRSWSDEALALAVKNSPTWSSVASCLGLRASADTLASLKVHAHRLELGVEHLGKGHQRPHDLIRSLGRKSFDAFDREAEFLAAAWFTAHGFAVSIAGPGLAYDLLIDDGSGVKRVQVKSTTQSPSRRPSATVAVARMTASGGGKRTWQRYAPDDFDLFFILFSTGDVYLVPLGSVLGQRALSLNPTSPYFIEKMPLFSRESERMPS